MSGGERLLYPADAAARLAVSRRTLERLRQAGDVRAVTIGRAVRYREADLDAFIAARATTPTAGTSQGPGTPKGAAGETTPCRSTGRRKAASGSTTSASAVIDFQARLEKRKKARRRA